MGEFVGHARYLLDRYLPEDYRDDATAAGVRTVVHVQAGWSRRIRSARLTRRGGSPPSAHLLAEPAFLRGFAAVAERGLSFDIWVYSHQLPDATTLVREYPQTTFVLDHFGTPVGALGPRGRHTGTTAAERSDIVARWRDDIAALAALPNVVAKSGGLGMPVLGAGAVPRERLRDLTAPLITHLYSVFGPQRTFWASNYPIDKPNVSLPESIWILREVLGDAFDEDAMLRDNARRVYRLSVP